jgi:hypothetical protein
VRYAYLGLAWLVTAAVVAQFFLAGLGAFGGGFGAHLVFAWFIALLLILLLIVSFVARVPWRLTGMAGGLIVLWAVQAVLAHTGISYISALHALNALAILGLSAYVSNQARAHARSTATMAVAATPP